MSKRPFVKRLRFAALFMFASIVCFSVGFVCYIRFVLAGDSLVRMITPHLQRALKQEIFFSSARISWSGLDKGVLTVSGVRLNMPGVEAAWLEIPECVFEVRLSGLLRGKLLVDEARIDRPVAALSKGFFGNRTGEQGGAETWSVRSLFFRPVIGRLLVERGSVILARPEAAASGDALGIHELSVKADNLSLRGIGEIFAGGTLRGGGRAGSIDIRGLMDSTPVSGKGWHGRISARLASCPVSAIGGMASLLGADLPISGGLADLQVDVEGRPEDCLIKLAATLSDSVAVSGTMFRREVLLDAGKLSLSANLQGDTAFVDVKEAVLPGVTLSGEARAGRIFADSPSLALTVKHADIDLEKLYPLIPRNLLHEEEGNRLPAVGLTGRVLVQGASWTGTVAELASLKSPGNLVIAAQLEGVSGVVPGLGLPVKNASGRIRINAEELLFREMSLEIGSSAIALNGAVTDLGSIPLLDLVVSAKALAQELNPLLQNKFVARRLPAWLAQVQQASGEITAKLDIKGSIKQPTIRGAMSLDQFQCKIEGFALPVKDVRGVVNFEGGDVTLSNVTAALGNTAIQAAGKLSGPALGLTVEGKIAPTDLEALKLFPSGCAVSGKIPAALTIRGKPNLPDFWLRVDLTGCGLEVGSVGKKKGGVPLVLEASGSRDPTQVRIEEAHISLDGSKIAARGTIDQGNKASLVFNLSPRGVQTGRLVPYINPGLMLQPGGRVEGDIAVTAAPGPGGGVTVNADLELHHVSLKPFGFYKLASGVTGKIRWRGDNFHAALESARIGSTIVSGSWQIRGWEHPLIEVNLHYSFLDFADFTAPPNQPSKRAWGEWIRLNPVIRLLARSKGRCIIRVDKGKIYERAFSDFKAALDASDGFLRANDWRMSMAEGALKGDALVDIRAETTTPLSVDFQGDHLKMQQALARETERVSIDSEFQIEGRLEWRTTEKPENNGILKAGDMEVRLRDGVIRRFETLSKIFSLINFGFILRGKLPDFGAEGLPFSQLTWEMEVFDNKWKVRNLKLLSDAATLEGQGMYFSDQGRVDFKVGVSPFVGFDKILSGLFGNLITRNGKLLTTRFSVRGPYQSPDVRFEPLESLVAE